MILRRVIGLIILAAVIAAGAVLYRVLSRRVVDIESDLTIREEKDIRGLKE